MRARLLWPHLVVILAGLAIVVPAGSLPAQQDEAADVNRYQRDRADRP